MDSAMTERWFHEACALWAEGQLKKAFRLFCRAAKAGDTGAQLNVGYFYDTGMGVRKSRTLAMHWYRKALRGGEATAATSIGTVYRDEGRLRLAIRWFEKAVALGDDHAMLEMAKLYAGPLKNPAQAKRLLSKVLSSKRVSVYSQEQARQLNQTLR